MATFEALQQKVSTRLKDPNNVDIAVSDVAAVINDAIAHWAKRRFWFNEFEETVVLTAGSPTVTLVTNPNPIEIFARGGMTINYASSRWPLTKVSPNEYDDMNVQGNGMPFAWVYRNGGYEVYYYPDQAYSLVTRGLKSYASLVGNSDTNDFTDNAVNLIVYEALSRFYAEFRQDEKMEAYYAARAENEYKTLKMQTNRLNSTRRFSVEGF